MLFLLKAHKKHEYNTRKALCGLITPMTSWNDLEKNTDSMVKMFDHFWWQLIQIVLDMQP